MTGALERPERAERAEPPGGVERPRRRTGARRIGLTGPIGCGKTTVAGWLGEQAGVVIIDADQAARDVLEPGRPEVEAVYARFGVGMRLADGSLDRAALGQLVFSDADALKDLESIVHPAVRPRILAALAAADAAAARAVVIEAIKLVESGLAELCDEVWLVTCDPAIQLDRVVGRGLSPEDARQRIEAQNDPARRLRPHATRVIETSTSLAATRSQLARALTEALRDPS